MCGISGIVSTELAVETMVPKTCAMTDAQRHRGPDDSGLEEISRADPAVVFGHRRLAIIDLTPAGHQPMHDPATGSWITFNGEIYNYRELRRELELCGQCFSTQCDTEVILKAYARWRFGLRLSVAGDLCLRDLGPWGCADQQRTATPAPGPRSSRGQATLLFVGRPHPGLCPRKCAPCWRRTSWSVGWMQRVFSPIWPTAQFRTRSR